MVRVPMQGKLYDIPDGDEGTRRTLQAMARMAHEYKTHPQIVGLARRIVKSCPVRRFDCEAEHLFKWVQRNIRWTRDVYGVETLATPIRILEMGAGDCDEESILLASLYMAVGFPVKFVAVANNPKYKDTFSHVFVAVDLTGEGDWVSADPSNPSAEFGWETPQQFRRMEYLL